MEESYRNHVALISCSYQHALAVGMYGHIYTWGKNTSAISSQKASDYHDDSDSDIGKTGALEEFTYQLGFIDSEMSSLKEPAYFSLRHPLYEVKASQVACGENFSVVVAVEKANKFAISNPTSDEAFKYETDELLSDLPPTSCKLKDYHKIVLANRIRKEVDTYLKLNNLEFADLFKSSVLNEKSFINILTGIIKVSYSEDRIIEFINYKNMRMSGKGVTMRPLYELVTKCKQGRGVLYIFGHKDIIAPKTLDKLNASLIKHDTAGYYLVSLPEAVSVSKVCCGDSFVLVLSHSGLVYTWGSKNSASLGKNRVPTYSQIKPITEFLSEKSHIKDIACGSNHCMAVNTSGILYTWGEGDHGKLGNGRSDNMSRPEPINVSGSEIMLIKAGHNSSFCLTSNGVSYAWGDVSFNKFGSCSYKSIEKPLEFTYDFELLDLAIGDCHCVFISKLGLLYQFSEVDDQIMCLNKNNKLLEGAQFYQVSAKGSNFIALSTKGSIFAWTLQKNPVDSLITSTAPEEITSCSMQFPMIDVEELNATDSLPKEASTKIVGVASSEMNTVLITDKGEAIVCGSNRFGQMGIAYGDLDVSEAQEDPDVYPEFVLVPRLSMSFRVKIKKLACGSFHMLAINEEDQVISWGANECGQLGLKSFSKFEKYPEHIRTLEDQVCVGISAGASHSMVLTSNGWVYSFGSAEFGKLGLGPLKPSVQYSAPYRIKSIKDIRHIDCGEDHSIAIQSNTHILFVWGHGWKGQLGCGVKESYSVPTRMLSTIEWKDAACGKSHTVGISTEGITYHWGEIFLVDEEQEVMVPVKVKGLEDISTRKAYASDGYSAALVEYGTTLYFWGRQRYRRVLGAKSDLPENSLTKIIGTAMPQNEKIAGVSLSSFHAAVVTDQGKVYTWGLAEHGRIGDPKSRNAAKAYDGMPVDLSRILQVKNMLNSKPEEFIEDLQNLLQEEPEDFKEKNIREIDQQIIMKFNECIEKFVDIASMDSHQEGYFLKVEHKQIGRLQQEPFRCQLSKTEVNSEIEGKILGYSSLLTTYQVHCCYMFKLLSLKIKEEKKIEMLNLIYCDMDQDMRLTYTAIYLCKMILSKILSQDDLRFPDFLQNPESEIYKRLVLKIVTSSEADMDKIRKIAESCIQSLSVVVHDDEFGIDPDPLHTPKVISINRITAYQINRNLVDRRMHKLRQVLASFMDILRKFNRDDGFSNVVALVIQDFLIQCGRVFHINYLNLDVLIPQSHVIVNTVLSLLFEPLCRAIENPDSYYVLKDILFTNTTNNFKSLSNSISKFFSGEDIGEKNDRWLNEVNAYNKSEENLKIKIDLLNNIIAIKSELEEEYLQAIFLHSLEPFDKVVTVNAHGLLSLHDLTEKNFGVLRVNNPSYDPLALILKTLGPVVSKKLFARNEGINLTLYSRSLRQDQSIVRCPNCEMLVPRDMSPNNFKPVIEIYDPMPPNSSEAILTDILSTGPRKQGRGRIYPYVLSYQANYSTNLKDFSIIEKVKNLILNIDTITSASLGIAIEAADDEEKKAIEYDREKNFKTIEENCELEYRRRKAHCVTQRRISQALHHLDDILNRNMNNSLVDPEVKKKLIFNVEYGASNLELEQFSDSVMFSIYMNKIREYTSKKEMSINLFENLTNEMKDSLRGFMKRSLGDLIRKKIIKECGLPPVFQQKNIVFAFEIDEDALLIMASNSPHKFNICGRDEFREEELLLHYKISSDEIAQMREESKVEDEDATTTVKGQEKLIEVVFYKKKLIHLIGGMEDKIAAYIQNIKITEARPKADVKKVKKVKKAKKVVEFDTKESEVLGSKHH